MKLKNKLLEKLEATYSSSSFRRLALAEEDRFKSPPVADEGQGQIERKLERGKSASDEESPLLPLR